MLSTPIQGLAVRVDLFLQISHIEKHDKCNYHKYYVSYRQILWNPDMEKYAMCTGHGITAGMSNPLNMFLH